MATRRRAGVDRLTAQDYFRQALTLIGDRGPEAMTIAVLCEGLGVTKGSFYHHFGGLPRFTEELLDFWEAEHSERLIAFSRSQPDALTRVDNLTEIAVGLPHASEAAIRAWARSYPRAAEAVVRVDRRRERHLVDAMTDLGMDREDARLMSRMAMDMLVGAQVREERVDLRRLRRMFEEVNAIVRFRVGAPPPGLPDLPEPPAEQATPA